MIPPPASSASQLSAEQPWPGLASFTEQDAAYFHGREIETREVFRLIKRGPVTLLFGKSGLGKTSLLNAGLFPLLQDSGFAPIYVRLDHDDKASPLAEQVQSAIIMRQARAAQPTLWEFFHRMDDSTDERRALPVIVLDQFEEIFTLGRESVARRHRSAEFFTQLADLIQNNCPAEAQTRFDADRDARRQFDFDTQEFRVLIAMREEYLPFFEESRQPLHTLLPQRLRLIEMNGTQALDAIQQAGGHLFDEGVGESIVRFVAGADTQDDLTHASLDDLELAPALLSLVCAELNDQRRRTGESKISQQLLSGRREQILTSFYERCFQGLEKEVRVFVEDQLLTTSGYRDSMAVEDGVRLKGVTQEAIDVLVERRLLRVDRRAGTSRVEITHDILIGACRRSRDMRHVREQGWWSKVLALAPFVEKMVGIFVVLPAAFIYVVSSLEAAVDGRTSGRIRPAYHSDDWVLVVITLWVALVWLVAVFSKLRLWNLFVRFLWSSALIFIAVQLFIDLGIPAFRAASQSEYSGIKLASAVTGCVVGVYVLMMPSVMSLIYTIASVPSALANHRQTRKQVVRQK